MNQLINLIHPQCFTAITVLNKNSIPVVNGNDIIIQGEVDPSSLYYSLYKYGYYWSNNIEYLYSTISNLF